MSSVALLNSVLTTFSKLFVIATVYILIAATVHSSILVSAYSHGAPCIAQNSLTPSSVYHGSSQDQVDNPPPYRLRVLTAHGELTNSYAPNIEYTVRLSGASFFRGFLLQARYISSDGSVNDDSKAGEFLEDSDWERVGIRFMGCPEANRNTITHQRNSKKYYINIRWRAANATVPVQFILTVVHSQSVFWTKWMPKAGLLFPTSSARNIIPHVVVPTRTLPKLITSAKVPETSSKPVTTQDAFERTTPEIATARTEPATLPTQSSTLTSTIEKTTTEDVNIILLGNLPETTPEIAENNLIGLESSSTRLTSSPKPEIDLFETRATARSETPTTQIPETKTSLERFPSTTSNAGVFQPQPVIDLGDASVLEGAGPVVEAGNGLEFTTIPPDVIMTTTEYITSPPDFCADNPCRNGGTCESGIDSFICLCEDQWDGEKCELENACLESPCENGGRCVNTPDGAACNCTAGFSGKKCDRVCPTYLCKNGGTCVIDQWDRYGCACPPGWDGQYCEKDKNDCWPNPCLNGGQCSDKFNGFDCDCSAGFVGNTCHRPCVDIYKSCTLWREEDRCVSMRPLTKFFDTNCAVTCNQCRASNATVLLGPPLPPVLEPFEFLVGRWNLTKPISDNFPIDFPEPEKHYEILEFSIAAVPMFGTPSLNYSSRSEGVENPSNVQDSGGFLTLTPKTKPNQVALTTVHNTGAVILEEGTVEDGVVSLATKLFIGHPSAKRSLPKRIERTFSLSGTYLRVKTLVIGKDGEKKSYINNYANIDHFEYFL